MLLNDPMERWEQLECYLTGRMRKDQHQRLQEHLATDPGLVEELETVRHVQKMLHEAFTEQRMRSTLQKIREEQVAIPTVIRVRPTWHRIRPAIAACLLISIYLAFAPITLPDAGTNVMTLRNVDATALSAEQRRAFENFFEGQARMTEGDYVQAAQRFENVLRVEDLRPYFKEAAEWHLALSYLKSRQYNRAHRLYQRLRECDSCTYEVGWLNHLKMKWQLLIASWITW